MNLNVIDQLLQSQFPTLMVPIHEALSNLQQYGHRFLMASNGVWMEVKRSWLYARVRISEPTPVAMPYGILSSEVELPAIPVELLQQFQTYAVSKLPFECAARIVLNQVTNQMRIEYLESTDVSASHINYVLAPLPSEEVAFFDIHSHGYISAFFSETDDADDRGETKIAAVMSFKGWDEQHRPKCMFRLCLNGHFMPLEWQKSEGNILFTPRNAYAISTSQ